MSVCQHRAGASHTLRFYITPHFAKCQPVTTLKLRFVSATASRPSGLQNRRYVKWLALRGRPAFQPRATVAGYRALPARVFQASRVVCQRFFSVSALRAGGRFAACSPPPTQGQGRALRALGPAPGGPSAPQGAPSPRRGGVGLWRALCLFVAPKVSARFASPRKPHPKELERVPQSCLAVKAASRRLRGGLRPALTASHLCCVLLS